MALPTSLDNINAMMYAMDRLKRERCADMSGLEYRPADERRMYPCPKGVKDCLHGRCAIATEKACKQRSGPFLRPKKSEDDEYVDRRPYLEWHDGKCVYGNFALRKWCELPDMRRFEVVPGVTDVHPFAYDEHTGKCSLTREYCEKDMQTSFRIDEKGRPTCYASTGEIIGEFFVGKTVFRGIERGASRLVENFGGPGVHLYVNPDGWMTMDGEAVRAAYPREKYTVEDLRGDNNLKRIYFVEYFLNDLMRGAIELKK